MNRRAQEPACVADRTIPGQPVANRARSSRSLWLLVVLLLLMLPGCSFIRHVSGSTMGAVGWLLISTWFVAAASIFAGAWWGLTVAFQESKTCGLLFLLAPPYSLYYMFSRWRDCSRPFLILLAGCALSAFATNLAWNRSILAMDFSTALQSLQCGRVVSLEEPSSDSKPARPKMTLRFVEKRRQLIHKGVLRSEVAVYDEDGRRMPSSMWLWLPDRENLPASLPCVFMAPGRDNLLIGKKLSAGNEDEHIPFVEAGFAVIAYELDGDVPDLGTAREKDLIVATQQFWAAEGGLDNARNAIEFALSVTEIDRNRLYAAGCGSAGTISLLLAAREPRIKGCMACSPVLDLEAHLGAKTMETLAQRIPNAKQQVRRGSPSKCLPEIQCPVYLFHSKTDSVVSVQQSVDAAEQLKRLGKQVTLDVAPSGDHSDAVVSLGIPRAVQWLRVLDRQRSVAKDK